MEGSAEDLPNIGGEMTVHDLRQKYIGKLFTVKASGTVGKCIQVNGYRREDSIVIRFCLHLDEGNLWYSAEDIQPVREMLF